MKSPQRPEAPEPETRITPLPVEVRAIGARRTIGGYGAVFNSPSRDLGRFTEIVNSKAFNKSAGDGYPAVVARMNHSDDMLLGTTKARTLRLAIDSRGLFYEVDLPESRADTLELVVRGDITSSSFAFQSWSDDWGIGADGMPLRTLLSVRLIDVAPLSGAPAYEDATVGLRSLARYMDAPIADVIDLSNRHELRKLFTRSDGLPPPVSQRHPLNAKTAQAIVAARAPQPRTGAQALIETLGRRWPAEPPQPKTGQQALIEVLGKRWGPM